MGYNWKDRLLEQEQKREKIMLVVLSAIIVGAFVYAGMK